ncbi:hypothetical protein A2331_01635 [Candidatus Falkowbacteria bacterium RIFOXYB2_FULL_34_18]|uniref:Uncharacterized protein n=1 Tax=Candidatus Falkowbacteria bacterium RIFOXYD2_FULL_34_120 TaxID=1798007 RepID=A0A1F5TQ07_9BACT|nr:MAG: hypothetical protein A2331_01635 [Candidatus Falkowbacteria bacterium RIFOXYB2_FULL_34_18]OGF29314.1 MAG: hypothetical protein A2500_05515 [Candidatus Falkowbacteria bacterium RIFOXYC12_FULL_34_55]OGF36430.1 MAG: hypothetical protein A2466_01175 [Candidatus Falkowbacteria bacterium RIFOXYC2_FULL_34_220]OGF38909.1 MAG: hypothetical protein A2515_05935 [Candidatus Falkowbacteria bacterium RIFOXYD12_FULL_34_57]OGF40928.1 MAG: hypothetical protein A2531_04160 [Candidatus Falkowbacteria bact
MVTNNFIAYSIKILGETAWDILFFPFWWYSYGLVERAKSIIAFLDHRQKSLALLVWIKNIHKPMYGQEDWRGRVISFLMRLTQVIIRSIMMLFWVIVGITLFFIWLVLPLFVVFQIFVIQFDIISLFSKYFQGT